MEVAVDTDLNLLSITDGGQSKTCDLYSKDAFEKLSHIWLKMSWQQKYSYTFTWLGRPIIQHPEDMVRMQEVICTLAPDVIVETGVAQGGSLVFSASLLKALGKGRVIGVDIEIRPHNRTAIEAHPLADMITLIEGDSTAASVVDSVRALIAPGDKVLVILDSDHSRRHVLNELQAYWPLVSVGSYIVATDGIMQWLDDVPRGKSEWKTDNPVSAVHDFLATNDRFELSLPPWRFNESALDAPITAYPDAWLKRVR